MSNTFTITPNKRANLRRVAATAELCCLKSMTLPHSDVTDLLRSLEQAEAEVALLTDYKDAAAFEAIVSAKLARAGDDFPCNYGKQMYCPTPESKGMGCATPWCMLRIARLEAESEIDKDNEV